ncbi:hypothetical protein SAMN06295888_1255 [Desulfonatronum zhilinae]|nr:hypothetical protein SAMN06295888_1255 [Desulfonatronum zhilinae]
MTGELRAWDNQKPGIAVYCRINRLRRHPALLCHEVEQGKILHGCSKSTNRTTWNRWPGIVHSHGRRSMARDVAWSMALFSLTGNPPLPASPELLQRSRPALVRFAPRRTEDGTIDSWNHRLPETFVHVGSIDSATCFGPFFRRKRNHINSASITGRPIMLAGWTLVFRMCCHSGI